MNRERQLLSPDAVPVRVQIGDRGVRHGPVPSDSTQRAEATSSDVIVILQGPAETVEAMAQNIQTWVEEEKGYEREKDHITTFDYPQRFANFLIGKKGENIRKYRDEFDVEIQVRDGKVEIKGPRAKAEAAKSRIVALGRKLEDEATHVLKIKPQYHRDLIGAKGTQVNRLQDRYKVRVNFPRSAPAARPNDDQSTGDAASEAGAGPRHGRPSQAPDEVIIRGPRKGADEARDELLNLLQWTVDHSYASSVSVARNQIPSLIVQGGREMDNLRMVTGAQSDVPDQKRDALNGSSRAEIRVKGTKKQVEEAKRLLEQRAKTFDDTVVRTLEVDKTHHRALIGASGMLASSEPDERADATTRSDLARHRHAGGRARRSA